MGLKASNGIRTWSFKGRSLPEPVMEANHIQLRCRPWDVPPGLALLGIGVVLCVALWLRGVNPVSEDRGG